MFKEIGSEFWLEAGLPKAISERDGVYVLSGRTAIDLIIQDILKTQEVRNVYMPAWCCDSMIMPFIDRGIKVDLYDVSFDGKLNYHVHKSQETDIFYVNNYFGYENTIDHSVINHFKAHGAIILYDKTHSFLMNDGVEADYSFASIRKWMDVIGGAVVDGMKASVLKPCPYLDSKIMAMQMKQAYMSGDDTIDKQVFLNLYAEFGRYLVEDYREYPMDDLSYAIYKTTDFETIKAKRKANAQYLHDHLSIAFLGQMTDNTVPLFVPVFFECKEQRDAIRKKLIATDIYCPIHWPKNQLITPEMEVNKIFDNELSLICDQRYGIHEMQRIIKIIKE